MAKFYPERPTANNWQVMGAGLAGASGVANNLQADLYQNVQKANLLQDMVERRTRAKMEQMEREQQQIRLEAEEKRKTEENTRRQKTQEKLSTAIQKGMPMDVPESLATGRPNALLGTGMPEPQAQAHRPATETDILGIASETMDPYHTASLANRLGLEDRKHGHRMTEIGARGDISTTVANIRARTAERTARLRAAQAGKDFAYTLENAKKELGEVETDIGELEGTRPAPPSDPNDPFAAGTYKTQMDTWNSEMGRLVSQKKFYEGQIYRATQGGAGPSPSAPPPKVNDQDLQKARLYLQKAGGDKAKARQLAAQDGWKFPQF